MAEIVKNDKKFKVISLSLEEAHLLDFGLPSGTCVCMHCNKGCLTGDLYYIAVLNDIMCKQCYEDWLKRARHYYDDRDYENYYFNHYKNILGL